MKTKIEEFKERWNNEYNYLSLELSDKEIENFIKRTDSLTQALDLAADYSLSQGLCDVEE